MIKARKDIFIFRDENPTPLGGISQYGFINNSRGVSAMRILGNYGLAYSAAGRAWYEDANGTRRAIVPGDLIIAFPELQHRYGAYDDQKWTEFYLVFNGPVFDAWRKAGFLDPHAPVLHFEPVDYWLNRLESVIGELGSAGPVHPLIELCRLQEVLADMLFGMTGDAQSRRGRASVLRACRLLESSSRGDLGMRDVARRAGYQYETFRKLFVRTLGTPPERYRLGKTIERACRMMISGSCTNRHISEELGFSDQFHFSKCFKKIVGMSPRSFRQSFGVK